MAIFKRSTSAWICSLHSWYPAALPGALADLPRSIFPNTSFTFLDMEGQWTDVGPKHIIHGRMLAGSIQSWYQLYEQAFRQAVAIPPGWTDFPDGFLGISSRVKDGSSRLKSIGILPTTRVQFLPALKNGQMSSSMPQTEPDGLCDSIVIARSCY